MGNPTAAAITHVLHNKHDFPLAAAVDDLSVVFIGLGSSAGTVAAASATPSAGGWRTPIPPLLPLPAEMLRLTVEGVVDMGRTPSPFSALSLLPVRPCIILPVLLLLLLWF